MIRLLFTAALLSLAGSLHANELRSLGNGYYEQTITIDDLHGDLLAIQQGLPRHDLRFIADEIVYAAGDCWYWAIGKSRVLYLPGLVNPPSP